MDRISYDWRNASADAVGEHGVGEKELKELAPQIKDITRQMNDDRKAGKLRYRDLPYDDEMLDAVKKEIEHFRDRCEVLLVLGIGGSALGNIALQQALNPCTFNLQSDRTRSGPQVFVVDNVDPDWIRAVAEFVAPRMKKTVINVISKSGETAETAAQFIYFRDLMMSKLGKKYKENIVATTDGNGGTLASLTKSEGYHTLASPDGVAGRFSVLSPVGLFSAGMCGIDIEAVQEGAAAMDKRLKEGDLFANPAAMIAAVHHLLGQRGKNMAVMMPYCSSLYSMADWFRQLWAGSLGKNGKGQTPIKALGTTDQHSQMQLYREGPNDKIFTFLEVEKFEQKVSIPSSLKSVDSLKYLADSNFQSLINCEKLAAEFSLKQGNRPTTTVVFPRITPETVGQFLYLYQVATSYMAALMDVNPFDHPTVELGKEATFALMGKPGFEELAKKIQSAGKRDKNFLL